MRTNHQAPSGNDEAGDLLIFVHIPKTAGTTLNSIFAQHYSVRETHEIMMRGMSLIVRKRTMIARPLVSWTKIRRLRSKLGRPDAPRLIHGHFDLSLGELLPGDAQYVTLLRDPVERAISHYRHYRRSSADPAHPLAMRSTLAQWVSTCGLVEMDNGQTRRLAGEMSLPVGQVSSRTLEKAKANLAERFSVLGLTEHFEEFQVLLHRNFNWPYLRYPSRNVGDRSQARTEISANERRITESCNRFDRELYQFVAEQFEQAASKFDMSRELDLLRAAPDYAGRTRSDSHHPAHC